MKVVIDEKKIDEILDIGIEDIFIKENLKKNFFLEKFFV